MIRCKVCAIQFKDLLKHLQKSLNCQRSYDLKLIADKRKVKRLKNKRNSNKIYYENNKKSIRGKKTKFRRENKNKIKEQNANYYDKTAYLNAQKRRFFKHFSKNTCLNYVTPHQEHLYLHTEGICQPESIQDINHSIEVYNGVCKFCSEPKGVKLIGVNRQVCIDCNKAECTVCHSEVSPDPDLGLFHYSPDTGSSLGFMKDYCPLYSNPWFPRHKALIYYKNRNDCRICSSLKVEYPEYEVFIHVKTESFEEDWDFRETKDIQFYKCNLCQSQFQYV